MTQDTIIDRIRKLFRLACDKGASEAEAASALAMAQSMMLKYNIEHVDESEEKSRVKFGTWNNWDFPDKWERVLATAVATLYNCRTVRRQGDYRFIGLTENIEACQETYLWVHEQVEVLYKQVRKMFHETERSKMSYVEYDRLGQELRKTFKEAAALRIYHRAAEIIAKSRNEIPAHMALVVIDQSLLDADDLIKFGGFRKGRISMRSGYGTGAGKAAGDQVRLQHGMQNRQRKLT